MGHISYPRNSGGKWKKDEEKLIREAVKRKHGEKHLAPSKNKTKIDLEKAHNIVKRIVGYPGKHPGTTIYYDPVKNISVIVGSSGSIIGIYSGRISGKLDVARLRRNQQKAGNSNKNNSYSKLEQEVLDFQKKKREEKLTQCRNYYAGEITRIHNEETITQDNNSSYKFWKQQETEEIVKSLEESKTNKLTVNTKGKILEGNTRILVLEERGYNTKNIVFSFKGND